MYFGAVAPGIDNRRTDGAVVPVDSASDHALASGPAIRKPLPAAWFNDHEHNADMVWSPDVHEGDACTPIERFFVRNHSRTPTIDPATYRLAVHGGGLEGSPGRDDAVRFGYDELRAMPTVTVSAVLECTGNGRTYFETQQQMPVPGTAWTMGGVGAATWTGVPLREILTQAGITKDAVDVMAVGLDEAYVDADGVDHGTVRRPLPVHKALDDVLLVLAMNGEPLRPDHGYPVRLLVPGWVGIASIKWLGELEVATRPLSSPWTTTFYRMHGGNYPADAAPLAEMPPKSVWELGWEARLPVNQPTVLRGRSWSGAGRVADVEVSLDGGSSWQRPRFVDDPVAVDRYAWVRWEVAFTPPTSGRFELLARTTDVTGLTQPDAVLFNDQGYMFWGVVRHPVVVT